MSMLIDIEGKYADQASIGAEDTAAAREMIGKIISNIETVIKGKHNQVEMVVMCLLAEGHVLIEDVPGVGKTSLVSSLAATIDCGYQRIQFTPDVMPSDISGFSIYNQKSGEFEYRRGAALSNIILADEINRASAKTQSAMLEIMAERQVTVDGNTYKMDRPYMVLATQNPIDSLGTYKLPEAQIDRFMVKISLGYPEVMDELAVILSGEKSKAEISPVTRGSDICTLIEMAKNVAVSESVGLYIVNLVQSTRSHPDVMLGASPRGSIALNALSRAWALYQGRSYVTPDDIKYLAPYVLGHRLILTNAAKNSGRTAEDIINVLLGQIVVPA